MHNFSPVHKINHPLFHHYGLNVSIKRDDLLHPVISGNKWRKLKYNIDAAIKNNKKCILSFGGSYSNHIHALAYACFKQGLPSIGIIRGEPNYANNFTLAWAKRWGMKLLFVDRKTYKMRDQEEYLAQLQQQFPSAFIVPEGGSNSLAIKGVSEISTELAAQEVGFDHLLVPVGSGGTLAGLVIGDNNQHNILGIAVLKQGLANPNYLSTEVKQLIGTTAKKYHNWQILAHYHRGGYAKFSTNDLQQLQAFMETTQLPLEPVYSGKMVLALLDLIQQGYFNSGDNVLLLHTGGLQGLGGLAERNLINPLDWPTPPRA
jgi:1-aminocyclopropane-1-carboxylate deaminase